MPNARFVDKLRHGILIRNEYNNHGKALSVKDFLTGVKRTVRTNDAPKPRSWRELTTQENSGIDAGTGMAGH